MKSKISKALLAVAMAASILLPNAQPAAAWNGYPAFEKGDTIYYCFNPNSGFTNQVKSIIRAAMETIDANASALTMTETFSGPACAGDGRGEYLRITIDSTACAFMCYIEQFTYFNIRRLHEIRLNPYTVFYWGGTGPAPHCTQYYAWACDPHGYTAALHESMHWLGFKHPGWPGDNLGSCNIGWVNSQTDLACDVYGERLMYAYAADGYYRTLSWPSTDGINGLNAWYDW